MALDIFGPTSISIGSTTNTTSAQYTASKFGAAWSVDVLDAGGLSPSDYTVTISSTGLLTVTLEPGIFVDPDATFTLRVNATTGPGVGNNGSLIVTVALPDGIVPCFVAGTLLETAAGPVPVEDITAGDQLRLADGGLAAVTWVGQRTLHPDQLCALPRLCPVRISRDALGPGLPTHDLLVSPQHRIVLEGWRAQLHFGADQVFAAAIHLVDDSRIRQIMPDGPVTYVHVACARHEVVLSRGLKTETLFPGDAALMALDRADVAELKDLFPEVSGHDPARLPVTRLPCLKRYEASVFRAMG